VFDDDIIEIADLDPHSSKIIKVIGVGGGGNNSVAHMFRVGNMQDVNYLVCNTDKKQLEDSPVPNQLQLGEEGLGAGGNPIVGNRLAEASLEKIKQELDERTKMVFVTAGMGGGTGTGAAPVIAREAMRKGILTIGVVTLPFLFELETKIHKAIEGLEEMRKNVDALLVINNERLREVYQDLSVINAFKRSDDILNVAVGSIVEIVNMHGLWNLDFRDIETVLRNGGFAHMSTGIAEGYNRLTKAIDNALNSPLLNNDNIFKAKRVVMLLTFSPDSEKGFQTTEMDEINGFVNRFSKNVTVKYGLATDESMGAAIKVTILASGFEEDTEDEQNDDEYTFRQAERLRKYYPAQAKKGRRHHRVFLYEIEDLNNEVIIDLVDSHPTLRRHASILDEIQDNQTKK